MHTHEIHRVCPHIHYRPYPLTDNFCFLCGVPSYCWTCLSLKYLNYHESSTVVQCMSIWILIDSLSLSLPAGPLFVLAIYSYHFCPLLLVPYRIVMFLYMYNYIVYIYTYTDMYIYIYTDPILNSSHANFPRWTCFAMYIYIYTNLSCVRSPLNICICWYLHYLDHPPFNLRGAVSKLQRSDKKLIFRTAGWWKKWRRHVSQRTLPWGKTNMAVENPLFPVRYMIYFYGRCLPFLCMFTGG